MLNSDCPNFFTECMQSIENIECANLIIAGDLNLALDQDKDKRGAISNNWKAA